ncbi:exodeoxyribonuclease V subunit gamma [Marihabitans asiaticum]|uniref:RecBCD enzyme subunit RecC n=1 Tax=Marihabitans asiaticum TaxID=415218 RepID=A0A560WEJ4_9MICO|nr:exodeoxyribonuclease V subunit gamma [Marihabitans asiaticum]TWD16057.1 DNA helicase/exodeoxyribonuclease V gamma subunit [Marihabitans asiaticum]
MPLHLHRAVRTDQLAEALGELLSVPADDPFAQDVVVVPEHGIERWLAQRLSHRLGAGESGEGGVCAGVRFVRPWSLVSLLTGQGEDDPWLPGHLVWPLLQVIDDSLDQPWAAPLARHLGHGDGEDADEVRQGRRYGLALRLARLTHRYAVQRPAVLTAWREGRAEDGTGQALPPDLTWQPELYRRLLDVMDVDPPDVRHDATLTLLRETPDAVDLPGRVSLFGHTRIAVTEMELLAALADHREVHLWLPQPSPAAWEELLDTASVEVGVVPRDEDRSADLAHHPLLASLGRDSRELARVLTQATTTAEDDLVQGSPPFADQSPAILLGWLQADLATNHAPTDEDRAARVRDAGERSLTVHACHGPSRQVEVLREEITGLLQDDPTLQPRDVLVMCPDVETYAPLIAAAFGLGEHGTDAEGVDSHPAHRLRVSLADRSLRATNPLLTTAEQLVALLGGRMSASEVLDLISSAPVRRRFRLDDSDLETITGWVRATGVRWGLDQASRAPFGLAVEGQNTWDFGLDRVLAGVAVSADGPVSVGDCVLPHDDVGSGSIDLAGRLAELVSRLDGALAALSGARSATDWTQALREGVLALTDVALDDGWQLGHLDRVLADAARHAPEDLPLRLADVRVLLDDRLAGRAGRASFRTGALTVCTMTPMRSVPHRVICLVGLDDDSFPRQQSVDGDDVLARRPMTGERDARSEDRQLLLDAIMAAQERLVITYTGADERTGERRPPAVPLGELIDAAADTTAGEVPVLRHPLQPFDPRNFAPGAVETTRAQPVSFDRAALTGAEAIRGERLPHPPLLDGPLPAEVVAEVSLTELLDFVLSPARTFLRDRLGVALTWDEDEVSDRMPISLDGLEAWQVGDRALTALLAGRPAHEVWRAELLRGELPPGGLAQVALGPVAEQVTALVAAHRQAAGSEEARSVAVDVPLPQGRRLTGTVDGVRGDGLLDVTYSRVGAKPLLRAWVRLLALSASTDESEGVSARVIGGGGRRGPQQRLLGPVDPVLARSRLADLVDLYLLGRTAPLPLPPKTSYAWAQAVHRDPKKTRAAARAALRDWQSERYPGEQDDRWFAAVYGAGADLSVLRADAAGPGTDIATLAPRFWDPILDNLGGGR